MENAIGEPQTIVLLGGTSDIGLAIAREMLNPTTRTVVLACRNVDGGERAATSLRHDAVAATIEWQTKIPRVVSTLVGTRKERHLFQFDEMQRTFEGN